MTTATRVQRDVALAPLLALTSAWLVVVLLAVLHVLRPELDPAWRVVSQYALGDFGWLMTTAFALLAASCIAVAIAIRSRIESRAAKAGWWFLLAAAIGLAMAAAFDLNHPLHAAAAMIGNPAFCVAAVLLWIGVRGDERWSSSRGILHWLSHAPWVLFLVMGGALAARIPIVGWANILLVLSYCAWLIVVAAGAGKRA